MGNLIFSSLSEISENELQELIHIDRECFGMDSWSAENFKYPLHDKSELSFFIKDKTKIIGFLVGSSYEFNLKKTSHINRVAVLNEYKMFGIGSKLVQRFLKRSRDLNFNGATLEFNQKLGLNKFYTKNSFSLITDEKIILDYLTAKKKLDKKDDFLSKKKLFYFTRFN
jgi:ribosomal protein S18 acetylase RimI-like enzyme